MPATIVIGLGWGDEGKGKVIDYFAQKVSHIARGQGGNNAGHTVVVDGKEFFLHLIPSGILTGTAFCYVGGGTVIDPESFLSEIAQLEGEGIEVRGRLFLSQYAHVILPFHKLIDEEEGKSIGTTGRGIGPCYTDAVSRQGIRVCDFIHDDFPRLFREKVGVKKEMFAHYDSIRSFDVEDAIHRLCEFGKKLKVYVASIEHTLDRVLRLGENVLLEGAQGSLLDVTFGTYPYVTSSHTISGGVLGGIGVGPKEVDRVVGVLKAYSTRVGSGPFPTEATECFGDLHSIREVGTTTGRLRRVGWFDAVLSKHAVKLSGVSSIALTKLDILSSMEKILICTGYELDGEVIDIPPPRSEDLARVRPVYEEVAGWQEPISDIQRSQDLPKNVRLYLEKIEELIEAPIDLISIGPERHQTVVVNEDI